jgi:hypothetical protein
MVTRTRPAKRRTPSAKYLAAYAAATPPPSSQKKKMEKKVTRGGLSKEDTPVPPELCKRPPEYDLPMLMPIGKYAASGMLPLLSFDKVPRLPPTKPPMGQYLLRKNPTPAPTLPRIIGLQSDVFNPLDHTSLHHPLPPRSFIAAAATGVPGKKVSSVGSPDGKWMAMKESGMMVMRTSMKGVPYMTMRVCLTDWSISHPAAMMIHCSIPLMKMI